ncbi:hypothetical protein [Bordetella avium]|uniref:hypothetical protein n=1 Tax=Bordetella avium TaxID=521 RepID=UPI000E115FA1|nr:hypothetical protein [Bordetella avium]SUW69024.1 phage protein [Bordetella avium]
MADYKFISSRGVVIADTADTRAQVESEFRAVFGDDMPTDPATPQGKLITRIVEERDAIARNNAELATKSTPPKLAGFFLIHWSR